MQKDFITVTPDSGSGDATLNVVAAQNTEGGRSTSFTVGSSSLQKTVEVNQEGKKEPTDMFAVSVFLCPNSYPGGYPEYEVYGGITQGPVAGNQHIIATLSIPRSNISILTDAGLYFQYMTDNMSGVEFSESDFQFGYEMGSETPGLVDMMNTQFAFGNKDDLVDIYPSELGSTKVLEFHMDFRGNGLQEGLDNSDTGRVNIITQKVIGSTNYRIEIIMSYK